MINIAILAATLAASTAAARLEPASLSVTLSGKAPATVRAELLAASKAVCRADASGIGDPDEQDDCVSATYANAMRRARPILRAQPRPIRSASLARP